MWTLPLPAGEGRGEGEITPQSVGKPTFRGPRFMESPLSRFFRHWGHERSVGLRLGLRLQRFLERHVYPSFLLFIVLFCVAGCHSIAPDSSLQRFAYAEMHMGTMFEIILFAPSQSMADQAAEKAFRRVIALEQVMTDYDPNSELMKLCQGPAGVPTPVSKDLFAVLEKAQLLAEKSDGAFDVTVGPFVQLWRKARKSRQLPSAAEITEAASVSGFQKMKVDRRSHSVTLAVPGMRLDLGGIGKGLAADEALKVLNQMGIRRAMVAASGDIAVGDPPPGRRGWSIGVQSIDHPGQGLTRSVLLKNAGISTSGDTEQFVEIGGRRYSHIVDPKTGVGLTERIGVTIIAPNGTTSDSLTKAVSVMGAERGMVWVESWPRAAALVVRLTPEGKKVIESRRFKDYLE